VIAVDRAGEVAMPFTSPAMSRGLWRSGEDPAAWV
jgi:isoaspartyl peptidase/L-asparaginase-like protein (Ntn-hydrolase superfamily)